MAHNLNFNNGKFSFVSANNVTPWHGLGQMVAGALTAQQALELGGLNFDVQKYPCMAAVNGQMVPVTGKFATVRGDNNQPLGIVGDRYQVVNNREAFAFFDAIVGPDAAIYETAGALGEGERIFITAKMPDTIRIAGTDDITEVYVMLTNTHDGSGAIIAAITPVRVVCQNTLNAALRSMVSKVALRHTTNVKAHLEQAQYVLGISNKAREEYEQMFNALACKKVSDQQAQQLIEGLFKSTKNDSTRIQNIRDAVTSAYYTGIGQNAILGTGWGLYNGITHYLSHDKKYHDADSKFKALIDGQSQRIAEQALTAIMAM